MLVDVYKRQRKSRKQIAVEEPVVESVSSEAVSYTHLDVYKRQMLHHDLDCHEVLVGHKSLSLIHISSAG